MSLKSDITRKVAEILGLETDEKSLKLYYKNWWVNHRNKVEGGLRLSEIGWLELEKAQIKSHKVKLEEKLEYTNQTLIKLDQYIDCPWFIYRNHIYVYSEKMAVQLILFSGNLKKYIDAKTRARQCQ